MKAFDKFMSSGAQKARRLHNTNKKLPSSLGELQAKLEILEAAKEQAFSVAEIARYNQKIKQVTREVDTLSSATNRVQKIKNIGKSAFAGGGETQALAGSGVLVASVDKALKTSDKLADVQRNLGKSGSPKFVKDLQKDLSKIDTRTSLGDLLGVAKVGAKFGVAKKEMLGFVKSVNQAGVGLADEFGGNTEEVANKIATVKNLFKNTKALKWGDAINRVGSVVNALGKEGKNSAPNLLEFTARVGQLGRLAPKLSSVFALGAVLEEAGIGAEIGSGGITDLIKIMGQKPKGFMQLLGLTSKRFTEMFNRDPSEIVMRLAKGFQGVSDETKVLEVLGKLGAGSQETMKTIMALSGATGEYKKRLAVASDQYKRATDLGSDYAIMNNTLAARVSKAKKSISLFLLELGQKLAPVVSIATSKIIRLTNFIRSNFPTLKPVFVGLGVGLIFLITKIAVLNLTMAANPAMMLAIGIGAVAAILNRLGVESSRIIKLLRTLALLFVTLKWRMVTVAVAAMTATTAFYFQYYALVAQERALKLAAIATRAWVAITNFAAIKARVATAAFYVQYAAIIAQERALKLAAIATRVWAAITNVAAIKAGVVTAATWLWNAAISANPLMIAVKSIMLLVGGFILAYKKIAWFRKGVDAAFGVISNIINGAVDKIRGFFDYLWSGIKRGLKWLGLLSDGVDGVQKKAPKIELGVTTGQGGFFGKAVDEFKKVAQEAKIKAEIDALIGGVEIPKVPGIKGQGGGDFNPNSLLSGGKSAKNQGTGRKVDSVESSARARNIYVNVGSFVEGGFHVNSTTIEEGAQKAKDVFMNMFAQVINSANDV